MGGSRADPKSRRKRKCLEKQLRKLKELIFRLEIYLGEFRYSFDHKQREEAFGWLDRMKEVVNKIETYTPVIGLSGLVFRIKWLLERNNYDGVKEHWMRFLSLVKNLEKEEK